MKQLVYYLSFLLLFSLPLSADRVTACDSSMQNLQALQDKKVDFILINSNYLQHAKESMPNLRAVVALYPKMLAFITKKDANITSLSQLKEKHYRINFTSKESESFCQLIFPAFEIKSDFHTTTFADATKKLKRGELDGIFSLVGHPDSDIIALNHELNITFVPLFGKRFDQLNNDYACILKGGMPKGIYKGLDHDIKSIGVKALIITREDVNERTVFELSKLIIDNIKSIKEADPIYRAFSRKSLLEGLVIPQHKGAVKAFNTKPSEPILPH